MAFIFLFHVLFYAPLGVAFRKMFDIQILWSSFVVSRISFLLPQWSDCAIKLY